MNAPRHKAELPAPIPDTFRAPGKRAGTFSAKGWVEHFNDPLLNELIQRGLKNNPDLKILATHFENALANARIVGAERRFNVDAGFAASQGENPLEFGSRVKRSYFEDYQLEAVFSWELDVWGRLKDKARSAREDLMATEIDIYGGKLSLVGKITRLWFNAITAKLQLALSRENLLNRKKSQQIVQSQYRAGISDALDLRLSLTQVAIAENSVHQSEKDFREAKRALKLLLGEYPDDILDVAGDLPMGIEEVPVGVPSDILERRPDILSAKHRLMAADYRVASSGKNFLPRISLTQKLGRSSAELDNLLDGDYSLWNLVGNLFQPVFKGGSIKAAYESAKADAKRAYITFGQTALKAFSEVESSLTAEYYLKKQELALEMAVKHSIGAEKLALEQYKKGVAGIIEVLNSQRQVLDSKSTQINIRNARLQARINLYLALGGKW